MRIRVEKIANGYLVISDSCYTPMGEKQIYTESLGDVSHLIEDLFQEMEERIKKEREMLEKSGVHARGLVDSCCETAM